MRFGGSVALVALGAILAFAVRDSLGGVDLVAVGYILILAGLLGAVLGLVTLNRSSGFSTTSRRTVVDGQQTPRQEVVEQDVR